MSVTAFTNGFSMDAELDAINIGDRTVLKINVEKVSLTGTISLTDGTDTIFTTESLAAAGVRNIDLPLGYKPRRVVVSDISNGTAIIRVFLEEPTPGGTQANVSS